MYKTEYTLGLVGNILGIIAIALILIVSLLIGVLFSAAADVANQYGVDVSGSAVQAAGAGIGLIILGLVLAIAAVVLGFIGTGKLKKEDKNGGLFLLIAGALALVSLFLGGVFGIVTVALYFIAGIMAMVKKPAAQA